MYLGQLYSLEIARHSLRMTPFFHRAGATGSQEQEAKEAALPLRLGIEIDQEADREITRTTAPVGTVDDVEAGAAEAAADELKSPVSAEAAHLVASGTSTSAPCSSEKRARLPFAEKRIGAHETEPFGDQELSTEEARLALPVAEEDGSDAGPGASAQPAPPALINLLVLFFFLYVGAEVGFGAWIAVVVLRDDLATEAGAALMARYGVCKGARHGGRQMGRIPPTRMPTCHLFFRFFTCSDNAQTVVK